MNNNRGYDNRTFAVFTERRDIALLPDIGKFCKCGCSKPIEGKRVTKRFNGGQVLTFYRPAPENKIFASERCRWRYTNNQQPSRTHLRASIQLKVQSDTIPYRTLNIYLKKGTKMQFKITPDNKEIWTVLNKINKFRGFRETGEKLNGI